MNSDNDELDEMFDECDECDECDEGECCDDDGDYEYVDYEKHLKDVSEYLKEEHPAILADMILKDIIK